MVSLIDTIIWNDYHPLAFCLPSWQVRARSPPATGGIINNISTGPPCTCTWYSTSTTKNIASRARSTTPTNIEHYYSPSLTHVSKFEIQNLKILSHENIGTVLFSHLFTSCRMIDYPCDCSTVGTQARKHKHMVAGDVHHNNIQYCNIRTEEISWEDGLKHGKNDTNSMVTSMGWWYTCYHLH